jgi:DNA-binding protein HU-beta
MSTPTVSKEDIVNHVAIRTGYTKKDVRAIFDAMLEDMRDELASGNKVTLVGFGSFEVRQRQAREGVKPGTTERIRIPAKKYPAFKPGKPLKDAVETSPF